MEHWYKLALAYFNQGKYGLSLKYLNQILNKPGIDIYDLGVEFWSLKEECHHALGDTTDASYCIDKGIEIDPSYYDEKTLLCQNKGDYEKALMYIERLLKIYPDSDALWCLKGDSHEKKGNMEAALECYDHSIHLNPTNLFYWIRKGSVLSDLGRFEGAVICLDQALKIDPANSTVFNLKGNALYSLGNYKDAIDSYDLALNIDSTNQVIINNKKNSQDALEKEDNKVEFTYKDVYICSKCGFENLKGARFCSGCGTKINVSLSLTCRSCGFGNTEGSVFCHNCGRSLSD